MKKFNIEFFVPVIPALAVIASALLAAVITTIFSFFCSSVNIANAHSNAFSSPPPSSSSLPLQSQQQQRHHQPLLNTNGINNINTPGNRLPTSAPPLSFRTEFPEPLCYFNTDPLFCPHYLWHSK